MYNEQTPYHKRRAARLSLSRQSYAISQLQRYTQIDKFMLAFEQAYRDYYGREPRISYKNGWYYVNGNKMRHSQVARVTANLLSKLQEEQLLYKDYEEQDDETI